MDTLTPDTLQEALQEPKIGLLAHVLRILGPERCAVLLAEALTIESTGGMLTKEASSLLDPQKAEPRWWWHAIDHHSGTVLAYVFGRRKDRVFLELQGLLKPFGITRFYTDGWSTYERHISPEQHVVGKQYTQ